MGEGYVILVLKPSRKGYEVLPDGPDTSQVTPVKRIENAIHLLDVIQDRMPEREPILCQLTRVEGR